MDNTALRDRFRHQLTNVHASTVLTVSIFEIIGYIILINSGVEEFSLSNSYLWVAVILPIIINITTHSVARHIINKSNVSRQAKNSTIIFAALITSFVVSIIHKEYLVTSCSFIFPMILSSMFNNKKLLNASFLASLLILFCVRLAFAIDDSLTLTINLNLLALCGFSFIAYICGIISINFSKNNYATIKSQAKQNLQLIEHLSRDSMTGLYNHKSFYSQLDKKINSIENNEPLCVAVIDVDDFKNINDTYGHFCGDTVLIYLADLIKSQSATIGTAFRYGGEEFAIIFSGTNSTKACLIVENILHDFRNHIFHFAQQSITFSAGIAEYKSGDTSDMLFEKADRTLYTAKCIGKNCVLKTTSSNTEAIY